MADDLAPFPDIEDVLVRALADFGTCGTVTPADLQHRLPFVRPRRLGGGGGKVTDGPRVDIDVTARTRAEAMSIARAVQQRLLSGPLRVPAAGIIDRAVTEMGPHEVPADDPHLRRVVATYRLAARRLTTAP
ncbi:hypothetical protein ADL21_11125 [Streptomyces albus subsp. albus]|nr:hypothetical protein ADL21_11125 [Streptomyces albus subsp. albus]